MSTAPKPVEESRDWHLDRRLQITHILTTLAMAIGAVLYVGDIKKDVEVLKMQSQAQMQRDSRQDQELHDRLGDLAKRLDSINDKLDRLVERRQNR